MSDTMARTARLLTLALCLASHPAASRPSTVKAACERVVSERQFQRRRQGEVIEPVMNRVRIAGRDSIRWNEAPVNASTLKQYFALTTTMTPTPYLVVDIAPDADPALIRRARDAIHRSAGCRPTSVWPDL